MNLINKENCIEVGYIQKPHGLKGEVILMFGKEFAETFEEIDYVFVEVDGGLVPFYISEEGFRFRNEESAICKFEFVDSQEKAKALIGCKVFVSEDELIAYDDQEVDSALIGMNVFDLTYGSLGPVTRVDDFSGNLVITVDHPKAEVMIPLSDAIITSIDDEKRELHLDCPKGLIEIYLE